jgi:integrase
VATIRRRESGRWQVIYRMGGRGSARRARTFATKGEAKAFAAAVLADQARGTFVDPAEGRTPFREYAEEWYARARRRGVRASTLAQYRHALDHDVLPAFGDKPLQAIRVTDLDVLAGALEARNLAPATVRQRCLVALMVLRSAVRDRLLSVSPAETWALPAASRRALALLNREQSARLIEMAGVRALGPISLGIGCGLRLGEVLGLRVDRVDFLRREVHVEAQLTPARVLDELKTEASRRVVPLPTWVAESLAAYMASEPVGDELLFVTKGGNRSHTPGPWSRPAFYAHLWKPAVARAGLDPKLGFHALRHTYASTLIDAGQNARVVQARMGHASVTETFDTYGHLFPDSHDSTRDAIDAAFSKPRDAVVTPISKIISP